MNSCLDPWLRCTSFISASRPPLTSTASQSPACHKTETICSSVIAVESRARLSRTLEGNMNGSSAIQMRRERKVSRRIIERSRPSIVILPDPGVSSLNRVRSRELLPLPVLPQKPTFEPAGMDMVMLSSVNRSLSGLKTKFSLG